MRLYHPSFVALLCLADPVAASQCAFTEVMYHPLAGKPEFIEVVNLTSNRLDMAKWRLTGGVDYTFPDFTPGAATAHFFNEYERIVLSSGTEAATRAAYPSISPLTRIFGPWTGSLNNAGDTAVLNDAAGAYQASLTFGDSGNWPVAADGTGHSLVLINQDRKMDDWRNWRLSGVNGGTPGSTEVTEAEAPLPGNLELSVVDYLTAVNYTSPWKYWRDAADPDGANPEGTWKGTAFVDTAWPGPGNGFFGVETAPLSNQIQTSFATGYLTSTPSYYFRTTFNWTGAVTGTDFVVDQFVDDGVIYWLNGVELKGANLGRVRMNPGTATHTTLASALPGTGDAFEEIAALSGTLDGQLVSGTNYLCAEVHQGSATSSDIYFGARLKIGVPSSPGVVINEVKPALTAGQGFVEFYNPTGTSVDLNGWYLSDTAANLTKYQITTSLIVPTLGLATIGFVESNLGVANPLVIYLTRPDGTTKQTAVSIPAPPLDGRSVGRKPVGGGQWYQFATPTPGTPNQSALSASVALKLSEAHFGPTGRIDWVEFANVSGVAQSGTGLFVASKFDLSDKVALPSTVPANSYASSIVDFPADNGGDVVLFLTDAGNNVLEAVELTHRTGLDSVQRFPATGRDWYNTATATRNAVNNPARRTEIVINEILYDLPSKHTNGEFIELLNRSGGDVVLTGWRLTKGLDYAFPPGTTIASGEHIVVAVDPAFITATYGGGVRVFGPAQGTLGNKGDLIRLEDANQNIADGVDYKDGGNWPTGAAGAGSSLELMHPDMDNSQPSSWRASNESSKSTFQPFSFTGIYRQLRGAPTADTGYKELLMNLVSDGHIVLRNVSLTRAAAPATNLIPGGGAVTSHGTGTGAAGWLCLGTHCQSDTLPDGFHLISQGSGDTKANKVEVDVTAILANDPLTFSCEARWISGLPLLVVQTWDRSFGKVLRLPIPNNLGTPGGANTAAAATPPPTVDNIRHSPAVPASTQPVVVTARVSSTAALTNVSLRERLDSTAPGGAFSAMAMNDSGTGGDATAGDGTWSVTVPARADRTITQFYVQATAANGQTNECPHNAAGTTAVNGSVIGAPYRPAMWIVDNSPPSTVPGTLIERFIISQYHRDACATSPGFTATYDWDHPRMSNFGWNATIIFNERDIQYNGELRRGGSPWTRTGASTLDRARWKSPGDDLFRNRGKSGTDNDAAGGSRFHNRMARYMLYLFAYPSPDSEFIQQIINADDPRLGDDQEQTDADFFDRAYGDGGELFEIDDAWFMFDTNNHDDRVSADGVTGRWSLLDWGGSAASPSDESPIFFHGNWPIRFPEDRYDYAALSSMIKTAFNSGGGISAAQDPVFREQIERQVDTERSAIYAAVRGYIGDWDNFTLNRGKNGYYFRRPNDGKFEFHHWDSDLAFQNTGEGWIGGAGGVGWSNYNTRPWWRNRFNYYLTELITKYTGGSARMTAALAAMNYQSGNVSGLAPFKTSGFSYPNWFTGRDPNGLNFVGAANHNRTFAITTANGQTVAAPLFTLNGEASSRTARVDVAGHPEAVFTWSSTSANNGLWTITNIALMSGPNTLTIRALATDGTVLNTLTRDVTLSVNAPPVVIMTSVPASPRVAVNQEIVLDATASFDPEGTPLNFVWTVTPATGVTVAHSVPGKTEARFSIPGIYSVSVAATDGAANNTIGTLEVTVFNANDFQPFAGGLPLGPQFTVQNAEVRDNFSAASWYSVEDITGRLHIQVLDDSAKPLASPSFTHPLITRDVPDAANFILQTDLEPDTREFGNWQSGLYLEMIEGGTAVRYVFSLDGGLNVVVRRAVQPGAYVQSATSAVTGSGAILRIRRSGDSLIFERLAGTVWTAVYTQAIPAGSVAGSGGIFVATSTATTVRVSFDYLLISDPAATNSVLANLRITEIMYNPSGPGGIEFIEITNTGTLPVELNGVYFEEGKPFSQFTFPAFLLAPGAFVVVTNVTPAAFSAAYPATPPGSIFQWAAGNLNNSGEEIILRDPLGNIIQQFSFDDDPLTNWPQGADGGGYSLEVLNTTGNYNSSLNWYSGAELNGSPGWTGAGPDTDSDGYPDRLEQLAGTNPSNGGSFFNATGTVIPAGQRISWPSYPGRTYHIETCPDLNAGNWTRRASIPHATSDAAGTRSYTITNPSPLNALRTFYRVVVELTP